MNQIGIQDLPLNPPALRWSRAGRLVMGLIVLATTLAAQSIAPSAVPAEADEAVTLRLVFSGALLRNTNRNDATAAYRALLERVGQSKGHRLRVITEVCDSAEDLLRALANPAAPVHMAVIPTWDLIGLELPAGLHPSFFIAQGDRPGRAYQLLVRRDRPWTSIADLRGGSLNWLDLYSIGLANAWMEVLLHDLGLPTPDEHFGQITYSPKATSTVLPVFFGKADACLIDEPSFRLMGELNPQVAQNLRVLHESEFITDVAICLRESDWASEAVRTDITAAIRDLHLDTEGLQILSLFGITRMVPFDPDLLNNARTLRARHDAAFPPIEP